MPVENDIDRRMAVLIQTADVLEILPEGEPRTLKDGSESFLFYDFGKFFWPDHMWELASCFAEEIVKLDLHLEVDFIFGPAYKGIGLAHLISVALWLNHEVRLPIGYNRKEEKDHGEGGIMVGVPITPGMRGMVIDDVLTGGTAKRESREILEGLGAILAVIMVGVKRSQEGVVEALQEELGARIYWVTTHDRLEGNFELPEYARI